MDERPDSGISADYFEYDEFQYDGCYSRVAEQSRSASLVDLLNYIDPASRMSDKEVIMNLIDCYLCVDTGLFEKFKTSNVTLNNLTRNCSLEVISKFEIISLKIKNLIDFANGWLNGEDCQVNNITLYTYLITMQNLLNQDIQRIILKTDEQIRQESIQFSSLWDFLQHLNSRQCGHLIDKVNLLSSINLNIDHSSISQKHDISYQLQSNHPSNHSLQNYYKLVSILDNLYLNLKFPTNENRFLWILFLNCLKPALKYLQEFLFNGYQTDPNNEFFFETVDYRYESDFWSTCLVMRGGCETSAVKRPFQVPICLNKCWNKLVNGLKSRLLLRYADQAFIFKSFNLYDELVKDLFLSLGFIERSNDLQMLNMSPKPMTSNAFNHDQMDDKVSKLSSSLESIDKILNQISSSTSLNSLNLEADERDEKDEQNTLETIINRHIIKVDDQIRFYENLNEDLIELNRQYELKELKLDSNHHELDNYVLLDDQSQTKQIKVHFCESLERTLNRIIDPISSQVSQLFKKDFLGYLKFFNDYYLMQLEQHSFSLFFDTLFKKLIYDPIGFQENLYRKFYDLRDFGFENTNLILFLRFSETFKDELIYFDIISRLNFVYNDLDWTSSTVINNDAQDFYNRSCKVLMKIKFIKWLNNNLPSLNRDLNMYPQRKLQFYKLIHRLFLTKHSLCLVVEALHSSLLMKINSLQSDLYAQAKNASNFQELVSVFQNYLRQVGTILHLDVFEANELDEESSPFHLFIRKLCEKAIDIWKIWFIIEELFYSNLDEKNLHRELKKSITGKKKVCNQINGKSTNNVLHAKSIKEAKLLNTGAWMNGTNLSDNTVKKMEHDKRSGKVHGEPESVRNEGENCSAIIPPTQATIVAGRSELIGKIPKHFNTSMDVNEMSAKLNEINKFLMANAKIFQI